MSFNIRLQTNNSADNVADKNLDSIELLSGVLKGESSIITPTILIEYAGALQNVNYFYIPQFQRYYFLTDIKSVRANLWEISGRCDVLTTAWKLSDLKNCRCITRKQQSKNNLLLNDGSFKVYQDPVITTELFPSGFNAFSYVLAVAGSEQSAST